VSPLWRDEVGAYLSPGRICLVRLKRGLRPAVSTQHEQALNAGEAAGWEPALAALDALLADESWRGAQLRLVLSDHWVRYAMVPWTAEVKSAGERLTHARQLLLSMYGELVSQWEVCVSESPPLCPRVACTIPAGLIADLRTLCAKHAAKIASLQPHLVASYASWRHVLPRNNAWFVTVDQGSLAAARIVPAGWDRVHSVRIGTDWTRELKRLQTFGRIASENPNEGRVYVDAPQAWREVAGEAGKDLQWLDEPTMALDTLQQLGRLRRWAA